jgi:hypothetical protein
MVTMDLYGAAHRMGTPNDDQSNGQGQPPLGPVGLFIIGVFLLGLAAWGLWSAIHGGDVAHWVVFVLLLTGGTSAIARALVLGRNLSSRP